MYDKMDSRTQLVCRTCLKVINENESYLNADSETKYGNLTVILETCVSELNLDLSDEVVICCSCISMLKISYEFKLRCMNTEDKVFGYLKQHNLPVFGKINLADVITHFNHLEESSFVDLTSEKYSQNENVATIREEIAERVTSNHYSLPTVDISFPRKDNSCSKNDDVNTDYVLNESAELNKIENLDKHNYNEDILMFDNLTNADGVNNALRDNYRMPAQENDEYRNVTSSHIESISQDRSNGMDWNMNFERCRLNSSKEEYFESLFESPYCHIDVENKTSSEIVFEYPLRPNPKRTEYCSNSF